MAGKDDLLAELIFKKHLERSLARKNAQNKVEKPVDSCAVCTLEKRYCICFNETPIKESRILGDVIENVNPPSLPNKLLKNRAYGQVGAGGTAKPYFFTQRAIIPAGAKLTLRECVRQIICITNVNFKCGGPILLSNLIFGNVPMWPKDNEIHIDMQCSFDIPNHVLQCGLQVHVTVENLDGAYSHKIFIMYSGVTIE